MKRRFGIGLWLLLLVLILAGLARLRFDVEIFNLLPSNVPAVQGLKLYQQNFANARELIITLRAPDAEIAQETARAIAGRLRQATNLIERVTWQPPWLESPAQSAELIAYLWLNQPPEIFHQLAARLAPGEAEKTAAAAREELATSMSPGEIGRLSYDPFGLTKLPEGATSAAPSFGEGDELFSSSDGTFRILFVQAATELATYKECLTWLETVKEMVASVRAEIPAEEIVIHYTGRPAFVAEISSGMERDITISVGGTSVIIAILFWLAHRRIKPLLWLLTLLALILAGTLALGGLIFGTINVVSMGFAAILLGLAVDYALVHYQEALAHPELSVPQIRRMIAPSISWAAITTITAFLVLNFGGLPGLAQLGSLVGIGVALSAVVMVFAFLAPLFPERKNSGTGTPISDPAQNERLQNTNTGTSARARALAFAATAALIAFCFLTLISGLPRMDSTANALRPRDSEAYAAVDAIKEQFRQTREPLWLLINGRTENDIAQHLSKLQPVLEQSVSNQTLAGFTLPVSLWPRTEFQNANRGLAQKLSTEKERLQSAAHAGGFAGNSLALTDGILTTWKAAAQTTNTFWPTNDMSRWIFEKLVARNSTNLFALGLLYLPTNSPAAETTLTELSAGISNEHVLLSGWELLGEAILSTVEGNLWKLLIPMIGLVLLSLWLAFRRPAEVFLSLATLLLSGFCLLGVMRVFGWSWNLLNLMALPLILGTGVDYSLFMQLALRRYRGDRQLAHRAVGRALLLCGGTAIAGFGTLSLSSNAGMASLGQVCAVGIACNMAISIFLLPIWWTQFRRKETDRGEAAQLSAPSSLYRAELWRIGLWIVRFIPRRVCLALGWLLTEGYWRLAPARREIVIQNLLPALQNDRAAATQKARKLFQHFAVKVVDLWRYEAGMPIENSLGAASGWENFIQAGTQKRGVLLLTPHLGNWEFGGPWLTQKGVALQVVTLAEPGEKFTELRQASRARWNIETLVIGNDPFAFLEIIRKLEAGATVALLIDRPGASTSVTVDLFGRPFAASIAAAELARASGCAILPVYIPRVGDTYAAHILPQISYERASLRNPAARRELIQQIVRAFEPAIQQHLDQWYHFIPIWPK